MNILKKLVLIIVLSGFFISCLKKEETIKIAAILTMTGSGYSTGKSIQTSLELLEEKINKNGGINDKKIEVLFYDNESSIDKSLQLFDKIENSEKPLFYLTNMSFISLALSEKVKEAKVPLLGIAVSSEEFTKQNEWCVRIYPPIENEINPLIGHIKELNLRKMALVTLNDAFGETFKNPLSKELDQMNIEYKNFSFDSNDKTFANLDKEINHFDSILSVGFVSHLKDILDIAKLNDFQGKLLGTATMSSTSLHDNLKDLTVYISAPTIYNKEYIFAKSVKEEYKQKFGVDFDHYGAATYDLVSLALEKLESIEPKRDLLLKELKKEYIYTGLLGIISSDENSTEISFNMEKAVIKNGEINF